MILITGGTGYLGSRLAHYLLAFGHEVIVASRYKKNKFPYLKDFRFVNFDLQNKEVLKQCLKNVDRSWLLCWRPSGSVRYWRKEPEKTETAM